MERLIEERNLLFINGIYIQQLDLVNKHSNQVEEDLFEYLLSEHDFIDLFHLSGDIALNCHEGSAQVRFSVLNKMEAYFLTKMLLMKCIARNVRVI
jgi:hypothetical protein